MSMKCLLIFLMKLRELLAFVRSIRSQSTSNRTTLWNARRDKGGDLRIGMKRRILAVANRSERRGRGGNWRRRRFLLLLAGAGVVGGFRERQVTSLDNFDHEGSFVVVVDERKVDLAQRRRLDRPVVMEVYVAATAAGVHRRSFHRLDRRLRIQFRLQALYWHFGRQAVNQRVRLG